MLSTFSVFICRLSNEPLFTEKLIVIFLRHYLYHFLLLFLSACVCLWCACEYACPHVYPHTWKLTLGIFHIHSHPYFLRQDLSIEPRLCWYCLTSHLVFGYFCLHILSAGIIGELPHPPETNLDNGDLNSNLYDCH